MKLFLVVLLTLSLNLSLVRNSHAVAAGVVAATTSKSLGAGMALGALGILYGSYATLDTIENQESNGWNFLKGLIVGLILLDNQGEERLDLSQLRDVDYKNASLTKSEITALKNNQEELEVIFTEAMKDRHIDLASARFEQARIILGDDALSGLYKVLRNR